MTQVDILLTFRTSGWVSIQNNGAKGKSVAVSNFLQANGKHMDKVCFGTEGYGVPHTLAVKVERIPAFRAFAERNGFVADYIIDGEPAMDRQARYEAAKAA